MRIIIEGGRMGGGRESEFRVGRKLIKSGRLKVIKHFTDLEKKVFFFLLNCNLKPYSHMSKMVPFTENEKLFLSEEVGEERWFKKSE